MCGDENVFLALRRLVERFATKNRGTTLTADVAALSISEVYKW